MITQIELHDQDALLSADGKYAILPRDYQLVRAESGEILGVVDSVHKEKISLHRRKRMKGAVIFLTRLRAVPNGVRRWLSRCYPLSKERRQPNCVFIIPNVTGALGILLSINCCNSILYS